MLTAILTLLFPVGLSAEGVERLELSATQAVVETTAPHIVQSSPSIPPTAVHQHQTNARVIEARPTMGAIVVPTHAALLGLYPRWLPCPGAQQPSFASPSLHILFCTWLA